MKLPLYIFFLFTFPISFYIFIVLVVDALLNMQLSAYNNFCGFHPSPSHTLGDLTVDCLNGSIDLANIHKEFGSSTSSLYHSKSKKIKDIMSKLKTNHTFTTYSIRQLATLNHYPNTMKLMMAQMVKEDNKTAKIHVGSGFQMERDEFDKIVSSWVGMKFDDDNDAKLQTSKLLAMVNNSTNMAGNTTKSAPRSLRGYLRQWHGGMKIFSTFSDLIDHGECDGAISKLTSLADIVTTCNISNKYLELFLMGNLERINLIDLHVSGMVSISTPDLFTIISVADAMMRKANIAMGDVMSEHVQSMNISMIASNITGIKNPKIIQKIFRLGNLSTHNMSSLASTLHLKNVKQAMLFSLMDIAYVYTHRAHQHFLRMRILHKLFKKSFKYLNKNTESKTILQVLDHFFSLNESETRDVFKFSHESMKVLEQLTLGKAMKMQRRILLVGDVENHHISLMDLLTYLTKTFSQPGIYTFITSSPFELARKRNKTFDGLTDLVEDEGITKETFDGALLNMWSRKINTNHLSIKVLQQSFVSYKYGEYKKKVIGKDFRPDSIFDLIDDNVYSK